MPAFVKLGKNRFYIKGLTLVKSLFSFVAVTGLLTGIIITLINKNTSVYAQVPPFSCPLTPSNLSVADKDAGWNLNWQDNSSGESQEDYYRVRVSVPAGANYGSCGAVDITLAPDITSSRGAVGIAAPNLVYRDYYRCNVQFTVCAGKSSCNDQCQQTTVFLTDVSGLKADIDRDNVVSMADMNIVSNCFDQGAVNGVWQNNCGYADIIGPKTVENPNQPGPPDGRVNILDLAYVGARVGTNFCGCQPLPPTIPTYGPSPTPTPTTRPLPANGIWGLVLKTDGTGIGGARVNVWRKICSSCSPVDNLTTTTDKDGYWKLGLDLKDKSTVEARIYESNAVGFIDSSVNPIIPKCAVGGYNRDVNTLSWPYPYSSSSSCGPFIFYDIGSSAGLIPTLTPTSAVSVSPTTNNNPYCSACGFFARGSYRDNETGTASSMPRIYSQFTNFSSPFSGLVNGARIKLSVWTAGTLGCKITNSDGTLDLTNESTINLNTGAGQWVCLSFPAFNVSANTQYRLTCRNASWGDFRWVYNGTSVENGGTYAVCQQ